MVSIILICFLILYLVWDYRYSRASIALKNIKEKEPEIYNAIHRISLLPPSSIIHGIMGQGLYLKINDKEILKEIKSIDEKQYKYVLWPGAIFILYIFYNLFIRAAVN